jgi:N-acetyl-anhydromuramyl-L-alanine amidase AmpD
MQLNVRAVVRSLLLGLAVFGIVLACGAVGAIPATSFANRHIETLLSTNPLAQANWFDRVAGAPATPAAPSYVPPQQNAPADPTNYGERMTTDIYGNPVSNPLIVVIHETVGSATSAINRFQTRHERDADQASYHTLIKRDGTVVYIVPPEMRAFGAGNSVFQGENGSEAVRTNPAFAASVNNFAYHTSLESPSDGRDNRRNHSGYTEAQYRSLAWVVAQVQVPDNRITTHRAVDRSGTRLDPRSFDMQRFFTLLRAYPRPENSATSSTS